MSNGTTTWSYTYDANGMRTSKTNGSATYTYVYNGGKLVQMTRGVIVCYFIYDGDRPVSMKIGNTIYYYLTNLQGDVVAITNESGAVVASYQYDAWGNILYQSQLSESSIASLNPLRYRGYVYDNETQLYYLQSRYYDPEVGRFLNADALVSTGQGILGNNMFAYCNNNPVSNVDPTGHALMQMSFDPDGASGLLTPGPWGGGSGGSSGMAYWANISPEAAKELANDVGEAICTAAEACWDVYMRSYNLQQNAQLQQAQMNINMFDSPEDIWKSVGIISATVDCAKAGYAVAVIITSPVPITVKAGALAVFGLVKGIIALCCTVIW